MGPQTILLGLGGVAAIGALALFLPKLMGKSKKDKLLDQFKKDAEQEKLQTEAKEISKEQQVIAAQIRASENASEETKTEIKKKLQKAAVEIQETLKKDNLAAIDEQIDEDWGNL
jgi:galactokinase/mevalonate kinase-like predicted kinase